MADVNADKESFAASETTVSGKGNGAERPDEYHPDSLRVSVDPLQEGGTRKAILRVPIRKPSAEVFIRVHPDPDYRVDTKLLILKEERETFLPSQNVRAELDSELKLVRLFTVITPQQDLMLWPCKLGDDGKSNSWNETALQCAELAMAEWVKVKANMRIGANEAQFPHGRLREPDWPDLSFHEILRIAFAPCTIDRMDHPVVKRMLGLP